MATTLEYGKKILLKRMIKLIEGEGYKVEYALDYEGYIIADKRDDPNIFLLAANIIDELRNENAGRPAAFLQAVMAYVKNNIGIGAASVPPSLDQMRDSSMPEEAAVTPPPLEPVTAEEAADFVPEEVAPLDQQAMDILDMPTVDDGQEEGEDVEEISNIIDEEYLK